MKPARNSTMAHRVQTALVRTACRLPGVEGRVAQAQAVAQAQGGEERTLHITFDDGPGAATSLVLSELANRGIRATFFVLGDAVRADPGALRAIREAGHAVGAHGMAHVDAWRHPQCAVADMANGCALLEDLLGERVVLVRPPFGRLTPGVWRWARRSDRRVVLWDVDTRDYLAEPPSVEAVMSLLRPGSILLLHENSAVWAEQDIGAWLDAVRRAGWSFTDMAGGARS